MMDWDLYTKTKTSGIELMRIKSNSFDEYISNAPSDKREALQRLREIIHSECPLAEEVISYGLAAFRYKGMLVAIGATERHCALYLMSNSTVAAHKSDLSEYDTSTGTIRFQVESPLPEELVRKLVRARIVENESLPAKMSK